MNFPPLVCVIYISPSGCLSPQEIQSMLSPGISSLVLPGYTWETWEERGLLLSCDTV